MKSRIDLWFFYRKDRSLVIENKSACPESVSRYIFTSVVFGNEYCRYHVPLPGSAEVQDEAKVASARGNRTLASLKMRLK